MFEIFAFLPEAIPLQTMATKVQVFTVIIHLFLTEYLFYKVQFKQEPAPFAPHTLNPNPATHQLYQFLGDGQAQSGAAKAPCD